MVTKAYIINKEQDSNKYIVRIPIFEKPGMTSDTSNLSRTLFSATLAHEPSVLDVYSSGDCVFVGFENNELNRPVILGKLYTKDENQDSMGLSNNKVLIVSDKASLPADTTIGSVNFKNLSNFFASINDTITKKDICVDSIQFKTANEDAGKVFFNDEEGTVQVTLSPNVTMAVGVDEVLKVYNDTDTPFVDGQIVYMSGNISGMSKVQLSKANDYDKVNKTIGVVTESIASHEFGFVIREGFVENILIDPSIYVNGDTLYLSPTTDGAFTKQKPISPNFTVQIGYVNKVSSDSITADGQIYVNINIIPILPTASTTVAGVVKIGTGLSMTDEVLSVINPGFDSQTKKTFLAAPNATDGVPTFREIIVADIPTLNQDTTGNAETATKLATARTFTITDNDATNSQASATGFDGSANFTVKLPSTIKATITGTASGNLTSASALDASKLSGAIPTTVTQTEWDAAHEWGNHAGLYRPVTWTPSWTEITSKPTTFAPIIGSGAGDAVAGNDARLTNARTPTSHTHGNITNDGKIGTTDNLVVVTGTDGLLTTVNRTGIDSRSTFPANPHSLVDTTGHTVSGLTAGHFLKATGATTYAFGAHGLTASDVGAVASNNAITGATKTKITYDSKGLVTAGADASLDDISDGLTRKLSNYVPKTLTVNGQALSSNVSLALGNLSDVTTTNPQTADLLRYNGTNWTNVPASGTYAGPTETLLGNRTTKGTIDLGTDRISNYDEIVVQIESLDYAPDIIKTRYSFPTSEFQYNSGGYEECIFKFPFSDNTRTVSIYTYEATGQYIGVTMSTWSQDTTVKIFGRNW